MSQDIFNLGDRVQAFKLGGYTKTRGGISVQEGDFGTIHRLDGDGIPIVKFDRLPGTVMFSQENLKLSRITFQQAYDRFLPYMPTANHHRLTSKLKVYRNEDGNYLSIELNGLDISYHKHEDTEMQKSRGHQAFLEDAFVLLDEYEETQKPVEVTLEQVAEKMGIDVKKLRIKE